MSAVSILHRGKRLCDTVSPLEEPSRESGEALRQRWLQWAERESMIWLVYFAPCHLMHMAPRREIRICYSRIQRWRPNSPAQKSYGWPSLNLLGKKLYYDKQRGTDCRHQTVTGRSVARYPTVLCPQKPYSSPVCWTHHF